MDATQVIVVLLGLAVVVILGGAGAYFIVGPDALRESVGETWGNLKTYLAARNQRVAEANIAREREQRIGLEVPASPQVILDAAVERMTRQGWSVQHRSETTASFSRDEGADSCLGCLLLLFFILPGILYLVLANTTTRTTVAAYPHEGGSRVVIGGDNFAVAGNLVEHLRGLSEPTLNATEIPAEESPPSQSSIAEKLRELSEARGAGLITPEEFEAKKRDLLDRM